MSNISDLPLPSTIDALLLISPDPIWLTGYAWIEEGAISIEFPYLPSGITLNTKAILNFPLDKSPMITTEVDHIQDNKLQLSLSRIHERDKRAFPRHYGNIPLFFRVLEDTEEELVTRQWKANVIDVDESWSRPEPFMNFSVSGVSFENSEAAAVGQVALVEFCVGQDTTKWRGLARVVRCRLLSQKESRYEIAIHFEFLPEEAVMLLSEFTLSIQEAMM